MEGGAAELHNEDYVFSNEISLKFQNQQKFWRFRQISLSKMWLELWREHENPHHFLVSKISDFVSPKATRGPEARAMAKLFGNSEAVSRFQTSYQNGEAILKQRSCFTFPCFAQQGLRGPQLCGAVTSRS